METTFLKKMENIFYLVTGDKESIQNCKCQGMEILNANQSEGAGEKHLPVIEQKGNTVTVKIGSVFHPMTEEHSISWIFLETTQGGQFVRLTPSDPPQGEFVLADGDTPIAAYAYCNLHGFWKTEV